MRFNIFDQNIELYYLAYDPIWLLKLREAIKDLQRDLYPIKNEI